MNRMARSLFAIALAAAAIMPLSVMAAPATLTISQNFRAFHPDHATIYAGDTIKILNNDIFVHQIYIDSPAMSFESGEQPPGTTIMITFPHPGTYLVQCHIHPMMRLTVVVQPNSGS
jgi:plastocyanin